MFGGWNKKAEEQAEAEAKTGNRSSIPKPGEDEGGSKKLESQDQPEPAKTEPKTSRDEGKKSFEQGADARVVQGQNVSAANVMNAFLPIKLSLLVSGRWPLYVAKNEDGTYTHELHWKYLRGIYFLGVTIYYCYLLVAGGYNLGSVLLANPDTVNFTNQSIPIVNDSGSDNVEFRGEGLELFRETAVLQRHLALCVGICTNVLICVIASFTIIWKHKYMVNYFNFWTRAIQTMHMDVAKGFAKNTWIYIGIFWGFIFALVLLSIFSFGATSVGAPVLMSMFTFRFFAPTMLIETTLQQDEEFGGRWYILLIYRILGGIGYIYIFVGAKVFILAYIFVCNMLRNAFAAWNGRVYAAILKGGDNPQTKEDRTLYSLLFKDHCVLLDLVEGTNRLFAGILESYFLLQVVAMCFEYYALIRVSRHGHDQQDANTQGYFIREYDFVPLLLIVIVNTAILYASTKSAAVVGEEAIAGLEVIRRKSLLGRKTDEELFFTLSMYTSYISYKKVELSAGGYFYINKEFVVTVFSTILSYFIILFQFQPAMDKKLPGANVDANTRNKRKALAKFLIYLENSRDCIWVAKKEDPC